MPPALETWRIAPEILRRYSRNLGASSSEAALLALSRAVTTSSAWEKILGAILVVRPTPQPILAVMGRFDATQKAHITAQFRGLNRVCNKLNYVDYDQAERDCQKLAAQLVEYFGYNETKKLCFTAIPRGGLIVLGMLAYALQLDQKQLEPPHPIDAPLVVIDDCALTGARLGRFLQQCTSQQVFFAHLYSHPDLRSAIQARESQVVTCFSAHDLHDFAPQNLGDDYPAWKEELLSQPNRYWVGQTEHICFAWNEPDRLIRNPLTGELESGWHIVPPELCLKNHPQPDAEPVPVQVQPARRGPLKPSPHVVFGQFEGETLLGNLETEKTFGLSGVAADMWHAIVEKGTVEGVVTALSTNYHVDRATLRADLISFIDKLLAQGLLEQSHDPTTL